MLLYKNGGFSLRIITGQKKQLLNFLAVLTPTVNLVHLKLFEVYCTHVICLFLTVKYSGDQTFNLVILYHYQLICIITALYI